MNETSPHSVDNFDKKSAESASPVSSEVQQTAEKKKPTVTVENVTKALKDELAKNTTEYHLGLNDGSIRIGMDAISNYVNSLPYLPALPTMKDVSDFIPDTEVGDFVVGHLGEILRHKSLSDQQVRLEREAESDPDALYFSNVKSREMKSQVIEKEISAVMRELQEKAVINGNVETIQMGTHLAQLPEYVRTELVSRAKQSGYTDVRISSLPNRGYGGNEVLEIEFVR